MSEPFVAEIRMVPYNFAPRGWAFCSGQLLPISQNTALFSLVGTIYGGDGQTTFALPDLRGRTPVHAGNAPGLAARDPGDRTSGDGKEVVNSATAARDLASTATSDNLSLYPLTGNSAGEYRPALIVNFVIALAGLYPSRD